MPNQRGENQKLLTVPADEQFIAELDRNLAACGYGNRSQFIRDAIIEKLRANGIHIPKGLGVAPARTPTKPHYPPADPRGSRKNEGQKVNSGESHGAEKLLKKGTASLKKHIGGQSS